ncbi:60 kDa chaperonin [Frankliniella fusca]|uniref:60 kDa chaperonin n=1 Tax=Frankliniella fusca TaxID=407009 RepID=A0AAE1H5B2_9NEOP|nr:60 kDa chaperonin [Frankliniella fusca]
MFHTPHFLRFLEKNNHNCGGNCALCRILSIWSCVKKGTVDVNLNLVITVINDDSPILEIFGGELNKSSKFVFDKLKSDGCLSCYFNIFFLASCFSCKKCESVPELLLCLQVKIDGAVDLQAAIDNAFSVRSFTCKNCSNWKFKTLLETKLIAKHPSILLVRPINETYENRKGFLINETIKINSNQYKIIGAILDDRKGVVRCPNSSLLSLENKKVRSTSWATFLDSKTGAASNLLMYENITPKATAPALPQQSTPVLDKTEGSEVQSTTKWQVTPIDQHNPSQSFRTNVRRKLYEESSSLQSSAHKFSRSASKVFESTCGSGSCIDPSLTRGRFIYIRTLVSFKTCSRKPEVFKFFTGLSVDNFRAVYNLLGGDERIRELKMKYDQTTPKHFPSKRILSSEDKLFMFLLRLRRGYPFEDLAYAFGIDRVYCSRVVYVVLRYLCITFQNLEKHLFISAESQNVRKPSPFKPFKNLRVIIDGFELYIDCPSNFQQQGNTYSDYKSHNTVRFILGISCYGGIIFVSPGYEGNMSERKALAESGFYDLLDEGDAVMSDRGFDINDDLLKRGVELIKPPSLGKRSHFTPEEEIRTRAIASARIYVEHGVRLIKANRLLRSFCTPLTSLATISDYVYVAGYLANFGYKKMCKQKKTVVEH